MEELMSDESRPAQLCRRYNITSSVFYHWKKQYSRGKFNNEPTEEGALQDRIEKLERLVGKLTLENEFLKRGLQHSLGPGELYQAPFLIPREHLGVFCSISRGIKTDNVQKHE